MRETSGDTSLLTDLTRLLRRLPLARQVVSRDVTAPGRTAYSPRTEDARVLATRDATWESEDHRGRTLNRTTGTAVVGGATLDNEELGHGPSVVTQDLRGGPRLTTWTASCRA